MGVMTRCTAHFNRFVLIAFLIELVVTKIAEIIPFPGEFEGVLLPLLLVARRAIPIFHCRMHMFLLVKPLVAFDART